MASKSLFLVHNLLWVHGVSLTLTGFVFLPSFLRLLRWEAWLSNINICYPHILDTHSLHDDPSYWYSFQGNPMEAGYPHDFHQWLQWPGSNVCQKTPDSVELIKGWSRLPLSRVLSSFMNVSKFNCSLHMLCRKHAASIISIIVSKHMMSINFNLLHLPFLLKWVTDF